MTHVFHCFHLKNDISIYSILYHMLFPDWIRFYLYRFKRQLESQVLTDTVPVLNAAQTQADVWLHQMTEDFLRKIPLLSREPQYYLRHHSEYNTVWTISYLLLRFLNLCWVSEPCCVVIKVPDTSHIQISLSYSRHLQKIQDNSRICQWSKLTFSIKRWCVIY